MQDIFAAYLIELYFASQSYLSVKTAVTFGEGVAESDGRGQ